MSATVWMSKLEAGYGLTSPAALALLTITILSLLLYRLVQGPIIHPGYPVFGVDDHSWGWRKSQIARQNYNANGKKIIAEGSKTQRPFQVVTDTCTKLFFPPKYAEELKDIKALSFTKTLATELCTGYPGFEPISSVGSEHNILQTLSRLHITPALNSITDDLSEEVSLALAEGKLGDSSEWHEVAWKPSALNLVARMSARLFVGTELCGNEDWLRLSVQYTMNAHGAAYVLRRWPSLLRRPASWFLPKCRKLRETVAEARRLLLPVIEAKVNRRRELLLSGGEKEGASSRLDTILLLHDALEKAGLGSNERVADAQLGLSLVAIHTTTELLSGALLDIVAQGPELVQDLRDEMVSVLPRERAAQRGPGSVFNNRTFYGMRLLDSVLKESQRVHTRGVGSMGRVAEAEIRLTDGHVVPRGAFLLVTLDSYRDEVVYPDPGTFRPRRFLELRARPGQEKDWQLVSTSPRHLGFGYGVHACPGRFFAAAEVKVALVHLLLKYDFAFPGAEGRPQDLQVTGAEHRSDPRAKILVRRKREEEDVVI